MAELLLAAGADPNAIIPGGDSVLNLAIASTNLNLVRFLLGAGADPNLAANDVTPLMTAARQGEIEAAKILLETGARPADRIGRFTASDYASHYGHPEIEELLRGSA